MQNTIEINFNSIKYVIFIMKSSSKLQS